MSEQIAYRSLDSVDGFDLFAELRIDSGDEFIDPLNPDEAGAEYSMADSALFDSGRWQFVRIQIVASRAGIELGRHISDDPTPYGTLANGRRGFDLDADPIPSGLVAEAIRQAGATLAKLVPQVWTVTYSNHRGSDDETFLTESAAWAAAAEHAREEWDEVIGGDVPELTDAEMVKAFHAAARAAGDFHRSVEVSPQELATG